MKGAVGTAMGGPQDSRKWALHRNRAALGWASDLLKLNDKEGGSKDIRSETLALCDKALRCPSLLEHWESRSIHRAWIQIAQTGRLRGIRQPRPFKLDALPGNEAQ